MLDVEVGRSAVLAVGNKVNLDTTEGEVRY